VDPDRASVVRRSTVAPARPLALNKLHAAFGALWVGQPGQLWRVAPDAQPSPTALPAGFAPTVLAHTRRWLWLADGGRLIRVDPVSGQVTATVDLAVSAGIQQLLGTPDGLYAVGMNRPDIWVLDPDSGALRSTVDAGGELVTGLHDGGGAVWATGNCGDVLRMPAGSAHLDKVRISDVSQDLPSTAALGSLWVVDEVRSEVVRVEPGRVVARIPVGAPDADDPAIAVLAGTRSVWVLDLRVADGVFRVDPATNRLWRVGPSAAAAGVAAVVVA
jgi:hypothetical protein